MSKFLNEFKEFAMRGNVLDMAVGVIIGGAFGKIVSSVVDDVIMPPIGWLIGGVNFADLKLTLPTVQVAGEEFKTATINYGSFLQTCFDFLIVAFCIFMLIKAVNKLAKKKEEPKEPEASKAPEPSAEEKLLMEIRDLLKSQQK
uniref:large-conductance mechanosensitive channel protein MscL n=1 Tax=Segatella hominis TaxID=2518605 RepID=UPI00403870BE